jgi:glycosyltransferase involved in cell wall biosynthesis
MMAIAGLIVGRIKKTETTLYALDLWPENLFSVLKIESNFWRRIAESVSHWHYRLANKIIAGSEKMRTKLLSVTKLPESKIIALHQACEKIYENDVEDRQLAARFKGGFNAVFTGNISPAQSFETVIGAAKKLKSKGITDINWIIVGDGMSRLWLENEVEKAGLSKSFFFEGLKPIEEMPRYTGIADVLFGCLVKSDLLEATLPAKVTSYIASGRPMVMALDGEARELINNKAKCGFASPTEDPDALASNFEKIYRLSSAQRQEMGKRGRTYHLKHLERNLVLGKLYDFIFG